MSRLAGLAGAAVLAAATLTACTGDDDSRTPGATVTATPGSDSTATPSSEAPDNGPPKVVGTIATGLSVPWGLAFLPDGDAVVTERDTTKVLLITGQQHDVREVGTISDAVGLGDQGGEAGLLGVAVSPTSTPTTGCSST